MSTANKLTYLNDTKTKLKNVINYAGANITNDTFRSYPEKLYDKFVDFVTNGTDSLYSSLPKVTGENTELTLNNTANGILKLDFKGNTSQNSTSGKNIFNKQVINWYRNNSSNYTSHSDSMTTRIKSDGISVIAGKTYTISGYPNTVSLNSTRGYDSEYNYLENTVTKNGNVITIGENVSYLVVQFSGENFTNETNILMKNANIQIEEGTEATSYEPYTGCSPAPNPEFPMDIHVVTGDNDVKIENRNLFNKNSVTATSLNADGTTSNSATLSTTDFIEIDSLKTYYKTVTGSQRVKLYDIDKNVISTSSIADIDNFTVAKSFTIPYSNAKYIRITVSNENVDTFMMVDGSTAPTTYIPHQEQTYRVDFGGKNLLPNNLTSQTINGVEIIVNKDKTVTLNGTSTSATNIYLLQDGTSVLKPSTYTMYCEGRQSGKVGIYFNSAASTRIGQIGASESDSVISKQLTINENTTLYSAWLYIPNGISFTNVTIKPMLVKGTEATRYSRYVENPIELCKIGEYEDKLFKNTTDNPLYNADLELNKWYKYGAVGKVVLDGSETITSMGWTNKNGYRTSDIFENMKITTTNSDGPYIVCNYFTSYTQNGVFATETGFGISNRTNHNGVIIRYDEITTVADFKTWLSTHNTTLYYALETPTYTLLDDTLQEQLNEIYYNAVSYEDQTNISQTNADLPFIISASAIRKYSE